MTALRDLLHSGFYRRLQCDLGVGLDSATDKDVFAALALSVRDILTQRWHAAKKKAFQDKKKQVLYLSAEFLTGRWLEQNLLSLGLGEQADQLMNEAGYSLPEILRAEPEPGLGNGGLGRLAACYLDSLATLGVPAVGHSILYDCGIFRQEFHNGWQLERPDGWLAEGSPWLISKPHHSIHIGFGGYVHRYHDGSATVRCEWVPSIHYIGTPHDIMVPGYKKDHVACLRLWSADAPNPLDLAKFNAGEHIQARSGVVEAESLSRVLYPNDMVHSGVVLRLKQQYFFVSCALQDALREHLRVYKSFENLSEVLAIQMNDTHPSLAVPELMRLLVDVYNLHWDVAWGLVTKTLAFTNHTLLPEALERWEVALFEQYLPRHLEIIYEINHYFLEDVKANFPGEKDLIGKVSIFEEGDHKLIRMANLACIGSKAINGVAALHTRLLSGQTLRHFDFIYPGKFQNVTNGVSPRRWMQVSNPLMCELISSAIGYGWESDLRELRLLEQCVNDPVFCRQWAEVKRLNKERLAEQVRRCESVELRTDSMMDILVKRIHEYKRQLMQAMHIVSVYLRLKHDPNFHYNPRTFIFGGKAAPGYRVAKLIIKLINSVAQTINNDPVVNDVIKVVYLKNFNVSWGEVVYPAADLSEQISTAGKEASGTGNMKFALNGALTLGTMDGATIEMSEAIGPEHFFIFGLSAEAVQQTKARGYNPREHYRLSPLLKEVVDLIASGYFNQDDPELFQGLMNHLLEEDTFMVMADFDSFIAAQMAADHLYGHQEEWVRKSILCCARMGYFSSDRAIYEYCRKIWGIHPDLALGKLKSPRTNPITRN